MSKSKKQTICGICWSKVGRKRVMTPCKHLYCTGCFFKWMKEKRNCPACRNNFDDKEIKNREELLQEINEQIRTKSHVLKNLRKENNYLYYSNSRLTSRNNTLRKVIASKTCEIQCLNRERHITRQAIEESLNYRREWEDLHENALYRRRNSQSSSPHLPSINQN